MSLGVLGDGMPTYLLASASVHTSAAACDHLADRLEADDTVMIDADELLVGRRRGDPEADGLGSTAAAVAGEATRPVVVVPT